MICCLSAARMSREFKLSIERHTPSRSQLKELIMASETIVAIYDNAADAGSAVADLRGAGFPDSSIEQHSKDVAYGSETHDTTAVGERHTGFWAWLTGEDSEPIDTHHALYDRSIESGSTVLTIVTDSTKAEAATAILESHNPVDITERHDQYGLGAAPVGTGYVAPTQTNDAGYGISSNLAPARGAPTEEVVTLSEEQLNVGKRTVDRGTTRIRRYVVERPVEEQITLRNETVNVFRRPATGSTGVGAFTDKTIEVTETAEEAVVAKTAQVVEEVVVGKTVEDRTETVRDTVRHDEVEVVKGDGTTIPPGRVA